MKSTSAFECGFNHFPIPDSILSDFDKLGEYNCGVIYFQGSEEFIKNSVRIMTLCQKDSENTPENVLACGGAHSIMGEYHGILKGIELRFPERALSVDVCMDFNSREKSFEIVLKEMKKKGLLP